MSTFGETVPGTRNPGDKVHRHAGKPAADHGGHSAPGVAHPHGEHGCFSRVPLFDRLSYFYGQLLSHTDFQLEQAYFLEKHRLHNRCLHGYGVVCGLAVSPEPGAEECEPESDREVTELQARLAALERRLKELQAAHGDQSEIDRVRAQREQVLRAIERCGPQPESARRPTRILIDCGLALDCMGHEILARQAVGVDIWESLAPSERALFAQVSASPVKPSEAGSPPSGDPAQPPPTPVEEGSPRPPGSARPGEEPPGRPLSLYVSICYCAQPVDARRPIVPDACGELPSCLHGRVRDSFRIRLTTTPPEADSRCEACCSECCDPCVLLARIDGFRPGLPLTPEQIHNEVRRPLSTYPPTTIVGINWTHDGIYPESTAEEMLGDAGTEPRRGGLVVRFSRPIRVATITRPAFELLHHEGGKAHAGDVCYFEPHVEPIEWPGKPGYAGEVVIRWMEPESLSEGDLIRIRIHGEFILDECCRAVDGANVGGRVPTFQGSAFAVKPRQPVAGCLSPPGRPGPWASGVGVPGTTFESWFHISSDQSRGSIR